MGAERDQPDMPLPANHTHAWYEINMVDARIGVEQGIPWVVTRFLNGPDVTGAVHPWYRAHCMN